MTINLTISTQGISNDLSNANGVYDTLDRGLMNQEQFVSFLEQVKDLESLLTESNTEHCPPTVLVEGPAGSFSFLPSGGTFFNTNTKSDVTSFEAVMLAGGQVNVGEKTKHTRAISGVQPARKPDIPPTDLENVSWHTVNTDLNVPQITQQVEKDGSIASNMKGIVFWAGIILFPMGLWATIVDKTTESPMFYMMLIGLVCIGLYFYYRARSKELFRLGFDWSSNGLWATRESGDRPSTIWNANMITDFTLKRVIDDSSLVVFSGDVILAPGEKTWLLCVTRVDQPKPFCIGNDCYFSKKKEAEAVLVQARQLLQSQV